MTALAANKQISRKVGDEIAMPAGIDIVYQGAMVGTRLSDGYAYPIADTTGYKFEGIAVDYVNNSAGAAGDKNVTVHRNGEFLMTFESTIAQTNVGDAVFAADDNVVDIAGDISANIYVGSISEYVSTTTAWVRIDVDAAVNAGGIIDDPGTLGAIAPVNGVCAMVTGTAAETRTLAIPSNVGDILTMTLDTDGGGNAVVTVASAINQSGVNTLTFASAGDTISLRARTQGGTNKWTLISNDSVALSVV